MVYQELPFALRVNVHPFNVAVAPGSLTSTPRSWLTLSTVPLPVIVSVPLLVMVCLPAVLVSVTFSGMLISTVASLEMVMLFVTLVDMVYLPVKRVTSVSLILAMSVPPL